MTEISPEVLAEVHHAQCRCHDAGFDCPGQGQVKHSHPYIDPVCNAKRAYFTGRVDELFGGDGTNMSIRSFIMDEVERQGWKRGSPDFWFRVGAMRAAWAHALGAHDAVGYDPIESNGPYISLEAVRIWGMLVEPEVNARGWRDCDVQVGGDICPPWQEVPTRMAAWATNANLSEMTVDEKYLAFEKIHPFRDGNGRTGKIIHNWLLGTLEEPVLIKDYFGGGNP